MHYLMPSLFFFIGLTFVNTECLPALRAIASPLESSRGLAAIAAFVLVVTPNLSHRWDLARLFTGKPCPAPVLIERSTALTLKTLKINAPVIVLDCAGPTRTFYAGLSAVAVWPSEKCDNFWSFVHRRNINLIVLHPDLLRDVLFRDDPEFQAFAAGEKTEDFSLITVPNAPVRIAVRKDLLASPHVHILTDRPPVSRPG
jgi:hypothetical protein